MSQTEIAMEQEVLARYFDHTLLKAEGQPREIEQLCDEAAEYGFFGVCTNSVWTKLAADRLKSSPAIALAVVGFPLGAMATASKVDETKLAVDDGAEEIDTVVQLGAYFGGDERLVREDLASVCRAAQVPVKVILETALLDAHQVQELTRWSVEAGAAYVKTSTGFSSRGASLEDVKLMAATLDEMGVRDQVGIKASGGIRDLASAWSLIDAGATRIGASASVAIVKELKA